MKVQGGMEVVDGKQFLRRLYCEKLDTADQPFDSVSMVQFRLPLTLATPPRLKMISAKVTSLLVMVDPVGCFGAAQATLPQHRKIKLKDTLNAGLMWDLISLR